MFSNTHDFEPGDIVRLLHPERYYYLVPANGARIAKIKEIHDTYYVLEAIYSLQSNELAHVPFDDVVPLEINSDYDKEVYIGCIIPGSVILPGGKKPIHHTDYSYYYDRLDRMTSLDGSTYKEVIRDRAFKYVHEFQHYLRQECGSSVWLGVK